MPTYNTHNGDRILIRTSNDDVIEENLELAVPVMEPPKTGKERGILSTESSSTAKTLERIFQQNLRFDIELTTIDGHQTAWRDCMALKGGPTSITWECAFKD